MGRNAKASSSKLPNRPRQDAKRSAQIAVARKPESEEENSEEEEEEVDEDDLLNEEPEEEGVAQYAPDDWDGEDDGASGSGSDDGSEDEEEADSASESEDDGKDDMVHPSSFDMRCLANRSAATTGQSPFNATPNPYESPKIPQTTPRLRLRRRSRSDDAQGKATCRSESEIGRNAT